MKNCRRRGFTLIELLVVIAIIGILSSVVVASLNSARKKARDARRVDDIKQLQLALDLYFDGQGGKYPAVLDDLKTKGYMPQVPTPPSPGDTAYKYTPLLSCTSYHLGITLEETGNIALTSDTDATAGTKATTCVGGTAADDFDGTLELVYDVKP
jgi:prepilin-type N-terminal cleavage/methylation domain-containing protein